MAFNRPTLQELVDRITNDLATRLIGSTQPLRRGVIRAVGAVVAGAVHLLYGFIEYLSKQIFADTAEDEYLLRLADIYGVARLEATFAEGIIRFTGVNGAFIPQGTLLQNSEELQYSTNADVSISAGIADVEVTCTTAGANGNMDAAETMDLLTPIADVDTTATVQSLGIVGGADEEEIEDLRVRLLDRIQQPPHGGNENDYVQWAKEVSGVTRAWVYPSQFGAGTVGVAFVRDDDTPSIIPSAGEVQEVQDYIDARRPVTADVTVYPPSGESLNFTIDNLDPDDADVKAAIEAELEDLIRREAEPGGTLLISHIREAISSAAGEVDHVLVSPSADVTAGAGNIFVMGTVTYT